VEQNMTISMKSKNALVHGVYSSDVVLPWEKASEFHELLAGIRIDLEPNGALENDIVFEIASLSWKKRRVNRIMQLALLQNKFAASIEESGKRSVEGIRTQLDYLQFKQQRKRAKFASHVSDLSESLKVLAAELSNKKKPSLGKVGSNVRHLMGVLEDLEPIVAAAVPSTESDEKCFDPGLCVDILAKEFEIEARLGGLLDKAMYRLVVAKEFRRQYAPKSNAKLMLATAAKRAGSGNVKNKIDDADWNDNDNNNDSNKPNPDNYDWQDEYDEACTAAARRKAG
jgi:hypothetical protein